MEKMIPFKTGPPPFIALKDPLAKSGFPTPRPARTKARWVNVVRVKKSERRSLDRLRACCDAFAILRFESGGLGRIDQMSMADIACAVFKSNPVKVGQIRDISLGGIAFSYVDNGADAADACRLDILVAPSAFYLEGLSFRTVTDIAIPEESDFQVVKTKVTGLQFKNLTPDQIAQLKRFLRRHTDS